MEKLYTIHASLSLVAWKIFETWTGDYECICCSQFPLCFGFQSKEKSIKWYISEQCPYCKGETKRMEKVFVVVVKDVILSFQVWAWAWTRKILIENWKWALFSWLSPLQYFSQQFYLCSAIQHRYQSFLLTFYVQMVWNFIFSLRRMSFSPLVAFSFLCARKFITC